jgi:hypothetical protein
LRARAAGCAAGANCKAADSAGATPLDLGAKVQGAHPDLLALLRNAAAVPDAPAPPTVCAVARNRVVTTPGTVDIEWTLPRTWPGAQTCTQCALPWGGGRGCCRACGSLCAGCPLAAVRVCVMPLSGESCVFVCVCAAGGRRVQRVAQGCPP